MVFYNTMFYTSLIGFGTQKDNKNFLLNNGYPPYQNYQMPQTIEPHRLKPRSELRITLSYQQGCDFSAGPQDSSGLDHSHPCRFVHTLVVICSDARTQIGLLPIYRSSHGSFVVVFFFVEKQYRSNGLTICSGEILSRAGFSVPDL